MTAALTNEKYIEEVIRWLSQTNRFSVPIAELPSPSVLKSKSSSPPEATPMNPSAAYPAVRQGNQTAWEAVALAPAGRPSGNYSPQPVHNVAKTPRCRSSHARTDQYTAAIAIIK